MWLLLFLVHLATAATAAADVKLRVAVCVVGQVSRTEIRSKVDNLIVPNLGVVDLDFFLILQPGQPRYTNIQKNPHCKVAPTSLEEAAAAFSPYVRTFSFENKYVVWSVDPEKWRGYPERGQNRINRLTNHINQFVSWRRCARLVAQQELYDGGGAMYDAVLRIRDNALVLKPFELKTQLLTWVRQRYENVGLKPPSVITNEHVRDMPAIVKGCSSWGGFSDKSLLAPRNNMLSALSGPADEFHLIPVNEYRRKADGRRIHNPETYLRYVYEKLELPVLKEPRPEMFPITDGRCEDGESFCVVRPVKDCRPKHTNVTVCKDIFMNAFAPRGARVVN